MFRSLLYHKNVREFQVQDVLYLHHQVQVPKTSSLNPSLGAFNGQQLDTLGRPRVDDGTDSTRHTTEDESPRQNQAGKV